MPRPLHSWQFESATIIDTYIAEVEEDLTENLTQEGIVSGTFDVTRAVYKLARRRKIEPVEEAITLLNPRSHETMRRLLNAVDWNGIEARAVATPFVDSAQNMHKFLKDMQQAQE